MAQRTKTDTQTQIDTLLPNNTGEEISPADHRSVSGDIKDSALFILDSNMGAGGTAADNDAVVYNGTNSRFEPRKMGSWIPVNKTDATGVTLSDANANYHWEVTGNVSPTFTSATGLESGSAWIITNSNADLSTVVTIAEGASCTSNFSGDLKIKPMESLMIIHQGSNRFVYMLFSDLEVVRMGFIVRYDGAGAWSVLSDTDHKPFYEPGITATASVQASTPNYLRVRFATTDGTTKIITGMIAPDEETMGLAFGWKVVRSTTNIDFEVKFGALRQRCIHGALTWGTTTWSYANYEGDVTPSFTTNTASQVVLSHTGNPGNLYFTQPDNSNYAYAAKQSVSTSNESITINIKDDSGAAASPTTGDRIWIYRPIYGKAVNQDFDADDLNGLTSSGNVWGELWLQRSKY